MKKISVIIPSYNSRRTLGAALASLSAQTRKEAVSEILIVDSSDDAATEDFLKNLDDPKIKVIAAGRRVIPARARNLGARLAREEILAFIDSDVTLAPNWIETVLEFYAAGSRIGGGSISLPEFQRLKWVPEAQFFLQFNEYLDAGPARTKAFLPSCNMFCGRALFEETGGFPELRAAEDVLFFLKAGLFERIWFIPEARAFHIFRENISGMLRNQHLLGKYVFIYRKIVYQNRFYFQGAWPLLLLPAILAAKTARIAARVAASGADQGVRFLLAFPVFLLGLAFWGMGFAAGVLTDNARESEGVKAWSY